MMQQVAASHSEVAALPFSASSTAKAVEAGLEAEKSTDNSQAFQALYRDAKSTGAQPRNHHDNARQSQNTDTASSSLAGKRDSSTDVNTDLPDAHTDATDTDGHQSATPVAGKRDTSTDVNTDLPPRHTDTSTDDARNVARLESEKRDSATDVHTDLPSAPTDSNEEGISQQVTIVPDNDQQLSGGLHPADNTSGEGTIPATLNGYSQPHQQEGIDEVYEVDKNGKKLADPIYTSLPIDEESASASDFLTQSQADKAANQTDTSWVDFIDAVRKTQGNTSLEKPGQDGGVKHDDMSEALAALGMSASNSAEDTELSALMRQFSGEGVDAGGLNETETVKIAEQLFTQLSTDDTKLSEETIASLKALAAALSDMSGSTKAPSSGELKNGEVSDEALSLDALLAQFAAPSEKTATHPSSTGEQDVDSNLRDGEALADETTPNQALSEDEQLILSLFNDALNEAAQRVSDAQSSAAQTSSTEQGLTNSAEPTLAGQTPFASSTITGETVEESGRLLLDSLASLSPQSAQKATEALAERVVSSLPVASSTNQQEAIKGNIIAGINEYQQQVAQGREPGIDLSTIVEQAALDAGLPLAHAQQLMAGVEAQAGQFLQLVHNTQSAAHNALATQFLTVDSQITETQQIRSEASKSQQQFEGFDKAVNIHKPEGQQQLNEKIRWMVNARNTMAEIRLDPPELGSMQVRVNVSGDAASVSFVVQSQHAKEVLADAMPKLRDMLSEQGIELGDAQVRKDNSSQSGEQNGQQLAGSNNNDGAADADGIAAGEGQIIEQAVSREAKGGIDYYA
ncbi:hypothetical protein GTH32_11430 [Alteromonas sp. 345S023]|uniref:Flagellar hook-length control protein-like C-terminal domain-containing protein n=1 Tax=Alteromonas profundi TaxID=2696062 RepID=A0A7X5LLX4_9ALTE|nr:flagellar hook-length control protein FliK [Alteromonas profundi]NDV91793.1 hypothetical protein [Alteromonas profundi]